MRKTLTVLVTACVLGGSSLAFAQGTGSAASSPGGMNHGSQQMHDSMMGGMQKMQGMQATGDTDKDFALMMRMHHQQAVDMAKVEVQHGKSPELKAMAQKIIRDQQKEISELDKWLAKHK
jgi:uncharacterized protein (DUF305 family)